MKPPDDTLSPHVLPDGPAKSSEGTNGDGPSHAEYPRTPSAGKDSGHGLHHYLREFLRPRYHLHKLKEDFLASVHALQNRDLDQLKGDPVSFARAVRGRLLATYFLVGPFGILGPISGTYFQYWIAANVPVLSHFVSLCSFFITIIIGNIFSIIGFQTIWAVSSRSLYRMKPPAFYNWLLFWKDILPLQWVGLQRWLGANILLMPLSALALSLVDRFLPQVAKAVPIGVLTPALELVFVHTSLIRLMGDLFERESHRIAANHAH